MDFVTPALLGGIALATIPVVLHLVMRQQPRHSPRDLEAPCAPGASERPDGLGHIPRPNEMVSAAPMAPGWMMVTVHVGEPVSQPAVQWANFRS